MGALGRSGDGDRATPDTILDSSTPTKEAGMNRHTRRHKQHPVVAALADTMNSRTPAFACAILFGLVAALFSLTLLRGLL
jgi:hypothetical protein